MTNFSMMNKCYMYNYNYKAKYSIVYKIMKISCDVAKYHDYKLKYFD